MFKKIFAVVVFLSLIGCSYSEESLYKSQAACKSRDGVWSSEQDKSTNVVIYTYCEFAGFKWRYDRESDSYIYPTKN